MYFVYVLQSLKDGRFYIGHCDHLLRRFKQHRDGENKSTKSRGPWWMPYYEIHPTRSAAMCREMKLKRKKSAQSIQRIISIAGQNRE